MSIATNDMKLLIRPALREDEQQILAIFADEGMLPPPVEDFLDGTVAVNSDNQAIGFIRILSVLDEQNPAGSGDYVYPVIVLSSWRNLGVARALVQYELEKHGQLKLVSCRPARGFYERTGFVNEDWANIAGLIAADCERCPDLESCEPQPYVATLAPNED
jgi:GNAT superfamily N-acetyltransferase